MRLLLAISASFMPSHIHDVKHEIRDRHAAFGGQRVWHHVTNVGSEAALAQNRLYPTAYRLQPITIHRLVPAVRPPLLHVTTAPVQQLSQQKSSKVTTTSLARRISSHIYNRNVDKDRQVYQQQQYQDRQSKQRSCENLVLSEEQPKTIRASKSLNALHGRTFVSKLTCHLIQSLRAAPPDWLTRLPRCDWSAWQEANDTRQAMHSLGVISHNFGKKNALPREEIYEYSLAERRLHHIPAASDPAEVSSELIDRFMARWGKCRSFRWSRLNETGRLSLWDRIAGLIGRQGTPLPSNSSQQKSSSTRKTRGSTDGYVNHGFSDSPSITTTQIGQIAPPLAQIAKFKIDLAGVKSELMQLQKVLATNATAEGGLTQTVSDYMLSSDDSAARFIATELARIALSDKLKRPIDNAELRHAVGELTTSLKRLKTENENLRQRVTGNPTTIVPSNGPHTWSFSSESIPNTPCSPLDTVQQTNFRLDNGQPYSTLSSQNDVELKHL
ncbi:hypothetical protein EGR_08200 [Echinococcus granulosus]|uniref:Uncharacterized protein n=1 Tax=Echinococcus granulosus TaxID=6210 RepID=W6U6W6_ECHGR|nr:hypothetical protein EGR_08200 [Echinococcus granulosus]EUB56963.1 hypothetical protein EGR_08200 [Echinococcus granulosus]